MVTLLYSILQLQVSSKKLIAENRELMATIERKDVEKEEIVQRLENENRETQQALERLQDQQAELEESLLQQQKETQGLLEIKDRLEAEILQLKSGLKEKDKQVYSTKSSKQVRVYF